MAKYRILENLPGTEEGAGERVWPWEGARGGVGVGNALIVES